MQPATTATVPLWAARVAWLATAVLGGGAIDAVFTDRVGGSTWIMATAAWTAWGAVATALALPSTWSLTVTRCVAPLALVTALSSLGTTASAAAVLAVITCSAATVATVSSGELGEVMAQAGAYGDERRFPLRPPVALLAPSAIAWCILAITVSTALVSAARHAWLVAVPSALVAATGCWYLVPRLHRLARRWLVLVPAGVVVHDDTVLATTVMLMARNVGGLGLAYADTGAADLTGPAAGHAIEIRCTTPETIVFAPTRAHPSGRAIHASALLVAPTRPGRALSAARQRGWA